MELYIRIVNGQPFEHPIFADNFAQAFPDVDVNNLPPEFARFERVEALATDIYKVCETTYYYDGTVVKDVHRVRPMTDAEKTAKIAYCKDLSHPEGWVFNEAVCAWQPPKE
jgi:hypothetical protein